MGQIEREKDMKRDYGYGDDEIQILWKAEDIYTGIMKYGVRINGSWYIITEEQLKSGWRPPVKTPHQKKVEAAIREELRTKERRDDIMRWYYGN